MLNEEKQEIVKNLLKKGILISPELLNLINENNFTLDKFDEIIGNTLSTNSNMKYEILEILKNKTNNFNEISDKTNYNNIKIQNKISKNETNFKQINENKEIIDKKENINKEKQKNKINLYPIEINFNYTKEQTKKTLKDFVNYFNDRFENIKNIIIKRPGFSSMIAIRTLQRKKDRETVTIVGMVKEINETKNGNFIFELEDPTGIIKVIVNKSKQELYDLAKNIVYDEVIGLTGTFTGDVIFVSEIIFPDVPILKEFPKFSEETYALFLGDIHLGSKYFMKKEWEKLMSWINGNYGNENQKNISEKTKYIFFMGDNVDGVGIYPNQDKDLYEQDIYKQYEEFEKYILEIPEDKRVIIIPGNHDASRISEPQPPIDSSFCPNIYNKDNITFLSSPSYITIGKTNDFSGINILLYHGYSFPYFSEKVESIRSAGGLERVDKIMSFLLQKRHLAPSHKSTLYIPGSKDNLLINPIPDIFATGHVHRTTVSSYKSIITLNSSSWLKETDYQKKVGLKPEPGKAILIGLHNKEVKVLNFN